MRKSLIIPLIAIGGGASYAAGVTEVATGPIRDDPSTWRWQVSSILAEQTDTIARRAETVGVLTPMSSTSVMNATRRWDCRRRGTTGDRCIILAGGPRGAISPQG